MRYIPLYNSRYIYVHCLLLFILLISGCHSKREISPTILLGQTMGTRWKVMIPAQMKPAIEEEIHAQISSRLETINQLMSTYQKGSEISRFNRSSSTEWFDVSHETAVVVSEAERISQLSDGAFDITVGPLVNLWNFGPELHDTLTIPSEIEIDRRSQHVGYKKLSVRLSPPAIRKQDAKLQIDLSAIAKGYAVDELARLLNEHHFSNYLVEIGGEIRTRGRKSPTNNWSLGIESPREQSQQIRHIVGLRSNALATSGDYRNFRKIAGKRYSHTIDPRTFSPVTHQLASASVIAQSCMTADALATTLMVLGPDEGFTLAKKMKLPVLLMTRTGTKFSELMTPEFQSFITTNRKPHVKSSVAQLFPTLLATVAIFLLAVIGMASGIILNNKRLKGSCGGLNALKDEAGNPLCESCTSPAPDCLKKMEEQNATS